jgi:hypothetical protein
MLEADGTLDALQLTGGSSLANPMYLFRGGVPLKEFGATLPPPMRLGFKIVGRRFFKSYPFEEAYWSPLARRFKDELDLPIILLGGINKLETIRWALDPGLVNDMRSGARLESRCDHCNKCVPTIYTGTRCLLP